jgi:outer membrane immunogenic protein
MGQAWSADFTPYEPVQVRDWGGFYIGGHAGYGEPSFDGVFDNTDAGGFLDELNADGFAGGALIGYNFYMPGAVGDGFLFGIEGDVTFTDWEDEEDSAGPDAIRADVDMLGTVRGRIGIVASDTLFFVTGGVAFIDGEYTGFDGDSGVTQSKSYSDVGGVVGGGIEYAGLGWANIRVEGMYYFFGDETDLSGLTGTSEAGDFGQIDDAWVVRGALVIPLNTFLPGL